MGSAKTSVAKVLFTKTQRRVLGLLFGNPQRSFYSNEIVRAAGAGIGTVQRELARLAETGLVTVTRRGNQKHYQANPAAPIFEELVQLVRKTVDPQADNAMKGHAKTRPVTVARARSLSRSAPVSSKLQIPHSGLRELCRRYHVKKLSLFGSAARDKLGSDSDIDLMVEFEPGRAPSLWDSPGIAEELSALFGHRRVDLVPPTVMRNPYRRKTILPDLRVLYEA